MSENKQLEKVINAKPYLIAEVGSNWHNSDDCIDSIKAAADCGVDAVKFQLFTPGELYGPQYKDVPMPHQLPREWLPKLRDVAKENNIDFMCTAFSMEGYDFVNQFVDTHKIACAEGEWDELVSHVLLFNKPTLVSRLDERLSRGRHESRRNLIILLCDPVYPSTLPTPEYFDLNEGFSDHTMGIAAAVCAAEKGACVIEKHFKLDRVANTPDAPHSIAPRQMEHLVYSCKQIAGGEIGNGLREKIKRRVKHVETLRDHNFDTKLKRQPIQGGMYRPYGND